MCLVLSIFLLCDVYFKCVKLEGVFSDQISIIDESIGIPETPADAERYIKDPVFQLRNRTLALKQKYIGNKRDQLITYSVFFLFFAALSYVSGRKACEGCCKGAKKR